MCGTESTFGGGWCGVVNGLVPSDEGIVFIEEPMPMPMPEPAIDGKGFVRDGAGDFVVIGNGDVVEIEGDGASINGWWRSGT